MPLIKAEDHGSSVADGPFAACLRNLIRQTRPGRIIETGTYKGTGTTRIIAESLRHCGLDGADFRSIECDARNCEAARANLAGYPAVVMPGLSLPRRCLPTIPEIQADLDELAKWEPPLHADYDEASRAQSYHAESSHAGIPCGLLDSVLDEWRGRCDLIVLDSAGHLGWLEFQRVLPLLKSSCLLAIDDTRHVKHARSLKVMKASANFRLLYEFPDDRFGAAVAHYNPAHSISIRG